MRAYSDCHVVTVLIILLRVWFFEETHPYTGSFKLPLVLLIGVFTHRVNTPDTLYTNGLAIIHSGCVHTHPSFMWHRRA